MIILSQIILSYYSNNVRGKIMLMRFGLLSAFVFLSSSGFAGQESSPDSLNAILLEELTNKRIVMLSDSYHGHGYFMNKVTGFLRYWIDQSSQQPRSPSFPSKLLLVLEMDQEQEKLVNDFIQTGDLFPFLSWFYDVAVKFGSNTQTVDYFEFFIDLRDLAQEIEKRRPSTHLELRILGPESRPPFDYNDVRLMSRQEFEEKRFLWFAKERDLLSATKIKEALNSHPEFKALVFYGRDHLTRGQVDKTRGQISHIKPVFDYFLVHHLDSFFNRSRVSACVFTYDQSTARSNLIERLAPKDDAPDFNIYFHIDPNSSPRPINFLPSTASLRILLDLMNSYSQPGAASDPNLVGRFSGAFYYCVRWSYLFQLGSFRAKIDSILHYAGIRPAKSAVKADVDVHSSIRICSELMDSFDPIRNIETIDRWLLPNLDPDSSTYVWVLREALNCLPSDTNSYVEVDDLFQPIASRFDHKLTRLEEKEFLRRKSDLMQCALVNFLTIGTEQEKKEAMRRLTQLTGLKYHLPKQWRNWWKSRLGWQTL